METNDEIIKKACEGSAYWRVEGLDKLREILDEARANIVNQIDIILAEMEKRADFSYKNATDLANKNYERGFFDGIHNARAKIKEVV